MLSRRTFLSKSATLGVVTGLNQLLPGNAAKEDEVLRKTQRSGVVRRYELTIGETTIEVGGKRTKAVAVNDSVPGPELRFREGDEAVIRVTNTLDVDSSIHWHGIILPPEMDGVPGVSFPGIRPGETFEYRFLVQQTGTYWYHSHSGLQEQIGLYGPMVIDPAEDAESEVDREYTIVLGDWTFENPRSVMNNLRKRPGYYNYQRKTLVGLVREAKEQGLGSALRERMMWSRMRMDSTDIADVTAATYTYLMNGVAPIDNWTGLFSKGERIRLRFINAGAATYFDVRIPGLALTVVAADGQDVQPVTVDEFRIAIAETYDVIVEPKSGDAYTIFAESMDRSGYARGTLAIREGMSAAVPDLRARPSRSMADMGMAHGTMGQEGMADMGMDHGATNHGAMDDAAMNHGAMNEGMIVGGETGGHAVDGATNRDELVSLAPAGAVPAAVEHGPDGHGAGNAGVPDMVRSRVHEPGIGLGADGWRVLLYSDLRSPRMDHSEPPSREIELHLTGNMERYMWSFDGNTFSESRHPIRIGLNERVRLSLVNDTMMEHPIHLHGMWMQLENGSGHYTPRKHTVNVKPAERLSVLVTPELPGPWAFHCHILYHMDMGMFRLVEVVHENSVSSS